MLKRKWKEEAAATPLTGLAIGVKNPAFELEPKR